MSPEATGEAHSAVDARLDQFSLGVALYEALTLERPFRGTSLQQIVASIQRDEPVDPRKLHAALPRDLATVVLKMLEKPPERRYASLSAVAADLDRFLANEPIEARPLGVIGRAQRWCRRHPGARRRRSRVVSPWSPRCCSPSRTCASSATRDRLRQSARILGAAVDLLDPWSEGQPVEQGLALGTGYVLAFADREAVGQEAWLRFVFGGARLLADNGKLRDAEQALASAGARLELSTESSAVERLQLLEARISIGEQLDEVPARHAGCSPRRSSWCATIPCSRVPPA